MKLLRREAAAAHEEKFRALADHLADLYFVPFVDNLELYLVRDATNAGIAAWIRSPEGLDVRLRVFEIPNAPESTVIDHVGRTELRLQQTEPTRQNLEILLLPNSDATQVLILPSSGRTWERGIYSLQLTYHRDYGDEMRSMDHRYDRPVESKNGDSSPVRQSLRFRV